MSWANVAGAAIGVVGSAMSSDSGGQTSTASKEPWEDAAPWIRDNIAQGQQLQNYYSQNPFNAIQQQGMQGLLSNYQHQNNTVIPGLMGFADRLMGQNYQRGQPQQSGLMASQPAQQPQPQVLQQQPSGMFTPPPAQQQSLINFNQMNPLYKDPAAAPPPPAPIPEGEAFRLAMADALFPESENRQRFGVNGPSSEEQYLRRILGRPSRYMDTQGG